MRRRAGADRIHSNRPTEPTLAPPTRRRIWTAVGPDLIVLAVALAVRLIFLYEHAHNPTFNELIIDAQLYDATARAFARGEGFGFGFFWQPFFYPFTLAVIYAITGGSALAARLVQLLVGSVTCVLVRRLGRRVFDERVGWGAGLMAALYGPLVFFDAELVGAGWAAFAAALLLLVLLWAAERGTPAAYFLTGLCGAFAVIVRPTFLGFFLAASVYLLVTLSRRLRSGPAVLQRLVFGALGFALIATPVALQCKKVAGCHALLPLAGGLNLYLGNNPDTAYTLTVRPGDEWIELQHEPLYAGRLTPTEQSHYFYGKVRDFAVSQPGAFVRGLGRKAAQFVNGREVPRNTEIYVFREWSPLLRALVWKLGGFGFPWTPLLGCAAVGLVFRRRQVPDLIKLFVLLLPAAIVFVFVAERYRLETVPVMIVLAAAGAAGLARDAGRRLWSRTVLQIGCAALVMGLSCLPRPAPEERINYAAEMFVLLGDAVHEANPQQAMTWYAEALRREPSCARAHSHLAALLAAGHREPEAAPHFAAALNDPAASPIGRALILYERGKAFQTMGKLPAALEDLNAAITLHPRFSRALSRRGAALYKLGRTAEARVDWTRALEFAVTEPEKRYARAQLERVSQPPASGVSQPPPVQSPSPVGP